MTAFAVATPSFAQDTGPAEEAPAADAGEAIIVTGSRIKRAGFDTDQPAVVVDAAQIDRRGYSNIGEALREQPAFAVPSSSPVGVQSGAISAGQTFVNFFGLGSQRTLTLVNGRRFVSSNTASIFGPTAAGSQVDLNTIPTKLTERVETIAVGGAPIYGSDAIAGTINVILKRDFEGFDLDAQYGISDRGDGRDYRIRGIAGFNFGDGRGNFTISGEYNRTDGLLSTDRRQTALQRFFTAPADPDSPFRNVLIENRRLPSISQNGVPLVTDFIPLSPGQAADFGFQGGVDNASGQTLVFDSAGNLIPIDFGQDTGDLTTASGGNGFNLADVSNLLSPTERYLATALFQYQVTDGVRFFAEGWYARSKGTELRAQPVYNSALFGNATDPAGNLTISIDNPYLTAAQRGLILANIAANPASDQNSSTDPGFVQDYFYLGRANTDLVSGLSSSTVEVYRAVAGFDGTFNIGDREISWEIVGNYGRSETNGRSRELNQQNFLNALNSTTDGAGNIICAPGFQNSPIATLSSTCSPLNPFGQQISQATKDYVTSIATPKSVNDQKVFTASVAGDLFSLPGGKVGFALGYEHREEKARFDPGAFFFGVPDPDPNVDSDGDGNPANDRVSYGRSVPIDPVNGKFNTDEVFGELRIPVISQDMDIPAIHSLEFNGAVRYVDHSIAGGDFTYTLGGNWQPIPDITIRGNYTRSIRAPAITELFNPTSGIFTFADDPCDARFLGDGPNPSTRAANCAAEGIPSNFQSLIVSASQRGSLEGNPDLQNEKANSYTIGAVFRPRFLPRFTASVDWVSIKLKDAILSLDADQVFAACYDSADFPNEFCGRIDRGADNQVQFVRTGYANAASFKYRGLLAEVAYSVPTPIFGTNSQVNLGVNYQYIDQLEQQVGLGDLTTLRGSIGYSKHKATANFTYLNEGFSWQVQAQYFGKAAVDPDAGDNSYDYPTYGDIMFVNTSASIEIAKKFTLRVIVDNVLDAAPALPAYAGGGTATYFDGVFGRSYKVGASVRF